MVGRGVLALLLVTMCGGDPRILGRRETTRDHMHKFCCGRRRGVSRAGRLARAITRASIRRRTRERDHGPRNDQDDQPPRVPVGRSPGAPSLPLTSRVAVRRSWKNASPADETLDLPPPPPRPPPRRTRTPPRTTKRRLGRSPSSARSSPAAERSDPRRGTSPSRAAVERCHLPLVPIREMPPRWTTARELASSPPRATATPRSNTAYPFDPTDCSRSATRFSPNSPPIRPWRPFRRTSSTSTTPAARASRSPVPGPTATSPPRTVWTSDVSTDRNRTPG